MHTARRMTKETNSNKSPDHKILNDFKYGQALNS